METGITFGDLFTDERPNDPEAEKISDEKEIESMVTVPIEQDNSAIPSMDIPTPTDSTTTPLPTPTTPTTATTTTTTRTPTPLTTQEGLESRVVNLGSRLTSTIQGNLVINDKLEQHRAILKDLQQHNIRQAIKHHVTRLTQLENLNIEGMVQEAVEEQVFDGLKHAMEAPLKALFRELSTSDMKDILSQRMFKTNKHKSHEVHQRLYEALDKSIQLDNSELHTKEMAEEKRMKRKRRNIPKPPSGPPPQPPPPPPPSGSSGAPGPSGAIESQHSQPESHTPTPSSQHDQPTRTSGPSSSKITEHIEYTAWTTTKIRHRPTVSLVPEKYSHG